MKRLVIVVALLLPVLALYGQNSLDRQVDEFDKVVVSPHINLVLTAGEAPGIHIEYDGVAPHDINVEVKGKTLRVYLENARVVEKNFWEHNGYYSGMYEDASITAYVTFTSLEMLEIRGDQEIEVRSPIRAEQFRLKVYGENSIRIAAIHADYFKVSLFGENDLKIDGGTVEFQKYTMYGENAVDVESVKSQHTSTNIYGESEIMLSATSELEITAMGEPIITYNGDPIVNKGIVLGEPRIFKR